MKKIIATIVFIYASCLVSCSDNLENYNENPNRPEVVSTSAIFNSATKEYTDFSRNAFNAGRLTLPWMQYWGQNAYADEDRYLYRETTAQSIYQTTYLVATDFKAIIDLNEDPATRAFVSSVGNNDNQIAASRIMLSYLFHKLTDFFGDVPYYSYGSDDPEFQALQVDDITSPVFASQEKIYSDILKELRESADMINTNEAVFTSGDNIYNGDATKWKKFANSLILRVANRLRNVNPTLANSAINAAIADGVFESNADNAAQKYDVTDNGASPFWRAFITRTDFAVAAPFVNLLKGQTGNFGEDPRLFKMAAPTTVSIDDIKADSYTTSTDPDDYEGVPYAFRQANLLPFTTYSFMSSNILKPDYQEVLMEYAEVKFILSEHNGFSQADYVDGVTASMEKWGVDSADIATFIGTLPPASEETVLNQKYVALYMQSHEAWAEYRRTGFPSTLVAPNDVITLPPAQAGPAGETTYTFEAGEGLTDLPTRLRYPVILQTLNGNNRADAVSKLNDGDVITSKLFWDVN
ncbi:SusD/RagB family nutrient-binding outer membrane lipoprotein [Aquimarina sp. 2-A2]|uniref:SusD/RagB family nutrient-binding outer membrane lipoprotein n=1 Tax=Aquimarina sp. 2-A2 TaxID=3382644 RepID=UPI00387EFF16